MICFCADVQLRYADMIFKEKIGEGAYAEVHSIEFTKGSFKGHHQAAAKKLNKLRKSEVDILRKVRHPNIIAFVAYVNEPGITFIVMELADESLRKYLDRKRNIPVALKDRWRDESAEALKYLHEDVRDEHGVQTMVIHRDIKAANCLLFGETLKIADFGISREAECTEGITLSLLI